MVYSIVYFHTLPDGLAVMPERHVWLEESWLILPQVSGHLHNPMLTRLGCVHALLSSTPPHHPFLPFLLWGVDVQKAIFVSEQRMLGTR